MSIGRIVLTGGGTAGHVTANLALLPRLREMGAEVSYLGSYDGIERRLMEKEGVPYYGVDTGKLRRYRDLRNLTDPFHVIRGFFEAGRILKRIEPDILFSKGGFVAVPIVWAAYLRGIPVVSHESDMTPGLANRLTLRCARRICCNFPETVAKLPRGKAVLTGSPIREKLLKGSREAGLAMTGFSGEKPVLMAIGGSLGSLALNRAFRKLLPELSESFDLVHICGKGNADPALEGKEGYRQYEYLTDGLRDLYALADLVISRAGANVICELLALKKPNILVPLPRDASRGDQILNAESFERQGFSMVLDQHEIEKDEKKLLSSVQELYRDRARYIASMEKAEKTSGLDAVLRVLIETAESGKAKGRRE